MKKLFYVMAFMLPFLLAVTSCSKDEVSSTDQLPGTEWEGSIGLGDLQFGSLTLKFMETTFIATARMDFDGDGEITDEEVETTEGDYTVDGKYIYMTIEGVTEKAELRDGKIYMTVADTDFEGMAMEFVLTQK